MRRYFALPGILATVALCAGVVFAERTHPTRATLLAFEKQFHDRILITNKAAEFTFVDPPAAYFLDNFGVMMTSEMSLVPGYGPTMFGILSPEQISTHRRKVIQRLPLLREQMKLTLIDGAQHFESLDDNDRLAVAVTVYHFAWEEITEVPSKIVMQGTKKSLIEAKAKTPEQGRDQAFQMKDLY